MTGKKMEGEGGDRPCWLLSGGVIGRCTTCSSYDINMYHVFCFSFCTGVFFHLRVTGTCPVTTDLIMRASVRTTREQQQQRAGRHHAFTQIAPQSRGDNMSVEVEGK